MKNHELKLNIGCGPVGKINGFINIDNSPSILINNMPIIKAILYKIKILSDNQYKADWSGVVRYDASKSLPYPNCSAQKIYSSHLLEHMPYKKGKFFLRECYRILKFNGVMRIVIPDLFQHALKYIEKTKRLLSNSSLPDDPISHDAFIETIFGAYLKKKRYGANHYYMYDLPSIVSVLKTIGFKKIKSFSFKEGDDKELYKYDSRSQDSLYFEVIK